MKANDSKLARLQGSDALTRVFERVDRATPADQHRRSLLDAAHVPRADQQTMPRGEHDARALNEILQLNPAVARDPNRLSVGTPPVVG